ncbi:MAG TPA: septum formation initiator family protein [Myxococcota bacterium]
MKGLVLAAALVAAALVYAVFDTDAGIGNWLRLQGELRESQARNADLRAEIAALETEAKALERGGFAVERAIREELGFARADETLLRLPRDDHSSARFP